MTTALAACLFLHYGAAMALFGAAAFRVFLPRDAAVIDAGLRRGLVVAVVILILSAIALLMATAGMMSGDWSDAIDPQTIHDVLFDTGFGRAWQWHLPLAVAAGMVAPRTPLGRPWLAVIALLLLAGMAFVGHAAMATGWAGAARQLNQAVHLLAAGAWLGGLVTLVLALRATRGNPLAAAPIVRRFSAYAVAAVSLVILTGIINSAWLLGSPANLVRTAYGWTLLVKLALVAVMTGIALYNRLRLTPRLAGGSQDAARRLRRAAQAEIALGFAAVLAASFLGSLPPPGG